MKYKRMNRNCSAYAELTAFAELFFLMSVLSKALFTLMRCHFVLLSFLSARHSNVLKFSPARAGFVKCLF